MKTTFQITFRASKECFLKLRSTFLYYFGVIRDTKRWEETPIFVFVYLPIWIFIWIIAALLG